MQEGTITCKNCGNHFTGKYCNQCGEKVYTEKDKSIAHLFEEGLHFVTHFEGKLFLTLQVIFSKPGKLSYDYCEGIRKKYFKPLSFFLLLVILYLIFPLFRGLNMTLENYQHDDWYSSFARNEVRRLVQDKHFSPAFVNEQFHFVSEKVSKFLLFITIPVLAAVCFILLLKKKRKFFDHFIFSIEINAFMILWGFLIFPLLTYLYVLLTGLKQMNENVLGIFIMGGLGIYTFIAS